MLVGEATDLAPTTSPLEDTSKVGSSSGFGQVFIKLHYLPTIQVEVQIKVAPSARYARHVFGRPRRVVLAMSYFECHLFFPPLLV